MSKTTKQHSHYSSSANQPIRENMFDKCLLTRNINVLYNNVGKFLHKTIENMLKEYYEGKCGVEGYIKPNSIQLISYSSGLLKGEYINFEVVFECLVCFPVEGVLIRCQVKNITKAGIRAIDNKNEPSPFDLFISRDHHYNNSYFNELSIGDIIVARVLGQRFELNDKKISIIGELVAVK